LEGPTYNKLYQEAGRAVDSELLRIVIPLVTFILGSLFTLLLKTSTQRRETVRNATADLVRLTKEWYNQIHQILLQRRLSPEDEASAQVLFNYTHNRLILPDLILQLEILRSQAPKSDLIPEVEKFLEAVTNYKEAKNRKECLYCPVGWVRSKDSTDNESEFFLLELDKSLQTIVSKAARALS
jgi:hypothetical protein